MSLQVNNGTLLRCSEGTTPSALTVLPAHRTLAGGQPAATVQDFVPLTNVMSFGMCNSLANPAVAAATAAKMGAFTPAPCVPATAAPWVPGIPTVLVGGNPTVDMTCKLLCLWAGVIQPVTAAQQSVSAS
jgi:hypothetical protein